MTAPIDHERAMRLADSYADCEASGAVHQLARAYLDHCATVEALRKVGTIDGMAYCRVAGEAGYAVRELHELRERHRRLVEACEADCDVCGGSGSITHGGCDMDGENDGRWNEQCDECGGSGRVPCADLDRITAALAAEEEERA